MHPPCVAQRPKGPGYADKEAEQDGLHSHPHVEVQQRWYDSRKEYPQHRDRCDLLGNPEVSLRSAVFFDLTKWGSPGKPRCVMRQLSVFAHLCDTS